MAYRATQKKPSSRKADTEKTEPVSTDPDVSVEDLVGAPVTSDPVSNAEKAPPTEPVAQPVAPSQAPLQQTPERPSAPQGFRPGFVSSGGGRGRYFHRRDMHGRGGSDNGGSARRPGGYGDQSFRPPRDEGAPRFSEPSYRPREEGNGFTQDVNVPTETVSGILDTMPEGHGFLRPKFRPSERDVYISQSQIRRFLLRNGDMVQGQARPPKENERYWGLLKVETVNGLTAETMEARPKFEDLVPIYPNKQLKLETGQLPLSVRIIDLVAPIGFGQRGLVVSPPKAGKTTILKELAAGITTNYPDVHLMAALIGERPEEVTDLTRNIKGEVLASNFDESPAEQTRIAEVALDRAKRLVEMGKDVVVLLDSITRLARAYNLVVNPSGRTLSGGFDPAALYPAKRFLGAARCVEPANPKDSEEKASETGGSLTVIGTALVDTGSRMDDLIYEEFKGTGNMELHLSRTLQERRIFPAIDTVRSGTRHDELLLGDEMMKKVSTLRHMLSLLSEEERTMMLVERLGKTKSNEEFLDSLGKG